jgi:hypothetical protein
MTPSMRTTTRGFAIQGTTRRRVTAMHHIRHDNEITHSAQPTVYDTDEKGPVFEDRA